MEKINAEFIFALNFAQNLTSLLLVFSKEAILFLIYLLPVRAYKTNNNVFQEIVHCTIKIKIAFSCFILYTALFNDIN